MENIFSFVGHMDFQLLNSAAIIQKQPMCKEMCEAFTQQNFIYKTISGPDFTHNS